MRKKLYKFLNLTLVLALFLGFWLSCLPTAKAASATLLLSPAKGTYNIDATFTVGVYVNSGGGDGINAAESTISYSKDLLSVTAINQTDSIIEYWVTKPANSKANGTIAFSGGSPSAYKGSSGKLLTISFKALKAGEAKVSFSGSTITASDGLGTNVFNGGSVGSYVITESKPAPAKTTPAVTPPEPAETAPKGILPPAPEVTSSSHPDENAWSSVNKVQFDWRLLSSITGVSALFNDSASSTPGSQSDGLILTKTYENVPDGKHYFHLKLKNSTGWGPASHRQILIDSEPPTAPELEIDNAGDSTNPVPLLKLSSEDKTSGLDKFKISLNNNEKEVAPRNFISEPYQFEKMLPGVYTVTVTAFDKAGNSIASALTFSVDPLKAPTITDMPKQLKVGEKLVVRGASFYPGAAVNLFISHNGGDPVMNEIKTDDNGDWNFFHTGKLKEGNYEIWAKIVDARGAESTNSTKQVLTVVSPEIIAIYGIYIIMLLCFVIIALIIYIFILKKNFNQEKKKIISETWEAKKKVNEIFLALQEEVDELIVNADKRPGLSESERRVKEKISEALDISEEFLDKEIEDIEKEVVIPKKEKTKMTKTKK